ncbi:MAG: hypothetical protein C4541_06340 [Candidatus Auribacter fodinae]|jgi:DNA-binding CsgD family transcriptional regulator|uniref:HTH luxR-type domain-containing protein n=1 Tax=Candidatus Auribacter fodinae TaxID=2093366 RepID=A0A3A4QZP8_9BACT|nr:MAG: hypothetical protein C4541_06340 [Candidatus Auribacter fodinae]
MKNASGKFFLFTFSICVYFFLLGYGVWLIKPDPSLTLSIPLRLTASIGAIIIFLKWRDWRILLVGAMFFFTVIRMMFTLLLGGNLISRTLIIEQLKEFPSLMASILACLSIVYLWRVFENQRRVRQAEHERDQSLCALGERVKTLDCLYRLSVLLKDSFASLNSMLEQAVRSIPLAFQNPENTGVCVTVCGICVKSSLFQRDAHVISTSFRVNDMSEGILEISRGTIEQGDSSALFSDHEKEMIPAIVSLLGSAIERYFAIDGLNRSKELLRQQNESLEQKNSALKEILEQIETEKNSVKDEIVSNIENFIMPSLEKLALNVSPREKSQLDIVKNNLNDILSSFGKKISGTETHLSPRELEICNLIKNGLSSKEISDLLGISIRTVERYRYNIRIKLELVNNKVNLITFLQTI